MNPAGISSTFFAPARVFSELGDVGSQYCHSWDRDPYVIYPQLPLQNTVTSDSSMHSTPRRVILNASARVMAYDYIPAADVFEEGHVTSHQRDVSPPANDGMYVFTGDLYMSVDMYQTPNATLSVFMPQDRLLKRSWIPAYMFMCIVMEGSALDSDNPIDVTLHAARGFSRNAFDLGLETTTPVGVAMDLSAGEAKCTTNVNYKTSTDFIGDVYVSQHTVLLDDDLIINAFPEMKIALREVEADTSDMRIRSFTDLSIDYDTANPLYSISSHNGFLDCDMLTLSRPDTASGESQVIKLSLIHI